MMWLASERELARRHLLVGVVVAGRVAEGRFRQADLARPAGHHGGEIVLRAGDALGDRDRGVVAGLDDDAAQEVGELDAVVELREHRRAAGRAAAPAPGVLGDHELAVEIEPALLDLVEDDLDRHGLGRARGRDELVRCLLEQDRAGVVVHQDGVRGKRLEPLGRHGRGRRNGSRGDREERRRGERRLMEGLERGPERLDRSRTHLETPHIGRARTVRVCACEINVPERITARQP